MLLRAASVAVAFAACVAVACAEPPPRPARAPDDGVPANSSSEARLKGEAAASAAPATSDAPADPTEPYLTPVGTAPPAAATSGGPKKTGPVSREECEEVVSHGLDLVIGGTQDLAALPPEALAQLKAQARKDKAADNPCSGRPGKGISRAEYDCGMAATTSDEFQRCGRKKK